MTKALKTLTKGLNSGNSWLSEYVTGDKRPLHKQDFTTGEKMT